MRLSAFASIALFMIVTLAPWRAIGNPQPSAALPSATRLASRAATKDTTPQPTVKLRIELTGGDDNQPIPDASVYLRFQPDSKARKGKQVEVNLKTSQEGVALSPEVPQGMILIQVVAPGWKTYGEWHDIEQSEQTVPIHLTRPTTKYY
jgi:hypothetical protein